MPANIATENSDALAVRTGKAAIASKTISERIEWSLFWIFIAGLAWCPIWFGSNTVGAWGINAMIFPGLALVYEISLLVQKQGHPVGILRLALSASLFAAVVVWIFVQNMTSAPVGWQHPIWGLASETLEQPLSGSISVNRDLTTLALVRLITAASVFWLALQLCRKSSRSILLIKSVAAIGSAFSAYGLFAYTITPGYILWFESSHPRTAITSTFYNTNSFAAYAGLTLVVICGLILRLYRHEVASGRGSISFKLSAFLEVTGRQGAMLLGIAFLVLVALLLTASRSGIAATGLGLLILGILTFGQRKKKSNAQREAVIFVALLCAAAFFTFDENLAGKIATRGFSDESRTAIYSITAGSISDNPFLGFGYGTFADVFPMFRDHSVSVYGKWEMAHSTYLEVLQGLGVIFGTMLIASVAILVFLCLKGATTRQENATLPCIAASVAFVVCAHSLVDFSLQIQAIALTFAALLGAGVAQSESSRLATGDN